MKFDSELTMRLIQAKCLDLVEEPKGFALELETPKGVFMMRMNKDQLVRLYKQSKAGDVEAMYVVSTLYDVGYGLPLSKQDAAIWANFSILMPAAVAFEDAVRKLKSDIANSINVVGDGYVYTEKYAHALSTFKEYLAFSINESIDFPKGTSLRLSPVVAGVHVGACYRKVDGKDEWVLYDMWRLDDGRMLPAASHFGSRILPMRLSEWKLENRIVNSNTVGIEGKYVFVYGTIAIRNDKKRQLRDHFPRVKKVSELVDLYLSSPVKDKDLFNESELQPLRSKWKQSSRTHGKMHVDTRRAKREYLQAKSALLEQKANYDAKQPEHYLDFIAYDMFGWSKGELLHITEPGLRMIKLQTTGFQVPTVHEMPCSLPCSNVAEFRRKKQQIFDTLQDAVPYKLLGVEVLEIDGRVANNRLIYKM